MNSLRGAAVRLAAVQVDKFLHFGIAVEHWGTGISQAAHDAVLDRMRTSGVERAWMRVFAKTGVVVGSTRKLGWNQTGQPRQSTFPPYAELLHYDCDLAGFA